MERKLILDFDRQQKSRKQKFSSRSNTKHGSKPNKKSKKDLDEDAGTSTTYRDRAKERRDGLNKDFELDPDDLIISNPIVHGEQSIDESERRRQQIEDSKYLGGDVEHTHLVKGLDFALLEKIKASEKVLGAEQKDQKREHDLLLYNSDSDEEEFTKEAILAANATSSSRRQIDIGKLKTSEIIPCRMAITRRILNVLDERWPEKSELFIPGRMSYVVPIDEEADSTVTTILRSKMEQQESETSNEKDLAFDQLINIFAKLRKGKR